MLNQGCCWYMYSCPCLSVCALLDDGWKLARSWHLANCEQGTNHRRHRRHLASITVDLVFWYDNSWAGTYRSVTLHHLFVFKMEYWWGYRDQLWLHLQFLCVYKHVRVQFTGAHYMHLYPNEPHSTQLLVFHQVENQKPGLVRYLFWFSVWLSHLLVCLGLPFFIQVWISCHIPMETVGCST